MFTACCLFFISPSFSFWTYPRMSCDELIKIHRIFLSVCGFQGTWMIIRSLWKDLMSHHFASERSRSKASFAHGYSSNILSAWWIQAYACKHATLSFLSRLSCTTHYQMEMERFELLTPCLQGRCSPNWATPPLGNNCIYFVNWLYILAATCSPTPSPVQYHRPLGS